MATGLKSNSAATKRIFVVDDHPLIREGLAAQIATQPGLNLCGEAEDVAEALTRISEAEPDLVIVDISLKNGNGIDLVKRLKSKDPALVILVLVDVSGKPLCRSALPARRPQLRQQEQSAPVRSWKPSTPSSMAGRTSAPTCRRSCWDASWRQQPEGSRDHRCRHADRCASWRTFELLGQAMTTQQIASKMHVSHKTVETYRARIKEKLGLTNAVELIQHAVQWVLAKSRATGKAHRPASSQNRSAVQRLLRQEAWLAERCGDAGVSES